MDDLLIPLAGIVFGCGIPITAIWAAHQRKMLEMKLKMGGQTDVHTKAAVDALREEIKSLRDTTLQYDLSFDTALQRMEQRVEGVERRVQAAEQGVPNELRAGR